MNNFSFLQNIDPDNQYYSEFNNLIENNTQSNYHSPQEYKILCQQRTSLRLVTYNVRSFRANSDSFFALLGDTDNYPEILVFTETWFTSSFEMNIQ